MIRRILTIGGVLAALAGPVFAAESTVVVDGAWARPSLGAGGASAAYFTIHNHGVAADTLVSVTTPSATAAALHESRLENSIAKMLPVQSVDIPAGGAVAFEPRGKHVMLMGLTQPLKVGDSVVLTLKLKNAGILVVTAPIRNAPPEAMSGSMGGMDMHH